jgi:hypothetical protein
MGCGGLSFWWRGRRFELPLMPHSELAADRVPLRTDHFSRCGKRGMPGSSWWGTTNRHPACLFHRDHVAIGKLIEQFLLYGGVADLVTSMHAFGEPFSAAAFSRHASLSFGLGSASP